MFTYELTREIDRCVDRIETLRREIDSQGPLPRIWTGRLRRDLEAEAVAASTILEGVAVTVDEARRILAGDRPHGVSTEDAAMVTGYREAMRLVLARADAPAFAWQSELVLAIHYNVLSGSFAKGAGRYRENQNWLTNRVSGQSVYLPPPADAVPQLVDELMEMQEQSTDVAPVKAALVHVGVAAIHPFRDGNGRTSRICASLAMYRAGYKLPQFTSLEEWWGRHVEEYYAAFECLGDRWDPNADVTTFVTAHTRAQAMQVEALSLRNATERALWTVLEDIAVHDLGLNERTSNALYDAFFAREVTNRYYRNVADVSDVTASHDLGKLVSSGLLESRGAGRSAHYVATDALYGRVIDAAGIGEESRGEGAEPAERRDLVLSGIAARLHGSSERAAAPEGS